MPVSVTEKATTASARVEHLAAPGSSPPVATLDLERHAAPLGELEGVGEQVLEHLLQPLGVGLDRRRQRRVELDLELEALVVGHLAEGALDVLAQLAERHRR